MSVADKLKKTGPRKLLSIDGGGIRGMMSVEVLARIEQILRDAHNDQTMRLCDYFDYIAGTSTGAIIATTLSWGMEVKEVRRFYEENGAEMFEPASWLAKFRSLGGVKFGADNLSRQLQDVFCEQKNGAKTLASLGTDGLKTLLMVVLRNATTDSPWPLSNNPVAKYNAPELGDCNLKLPLWQLVRASTAAPTYFPPEVVKVGQQEFVFVDGGMTMYNNPAFQLFKMATLEPYRLNWPTGEDKMLLVSVGTGFADDANKNLKPEQMNLVYSAGKIPAALMNAALHEQDLLCRMFGNCRSGDPTEIDGEVGSLIPGTVAGMDKKLFTYVRYNAALTEKGLAGLGLSDIKPADVQQMDSVAHIPELKRVGEAVGQQRVKPEHFAGFLPK